VQQDGLVVEVVQQLAFLLAHTREGVLEKGARSGSEQASAAALREDVAEALFSLFSREENASVAVGKQRTLVVRLVQELLPLLGTQERATVTKYACGALCNILYQTSAANAIGQHQQLAVEVVERLLPLLRSSDTDVALGAIQGLSNLLAGSKTAAAAVAHQQQLLDGLVDQLLPVLLMPREEAEVKKHLTQRKPQLKAEVNKRRNPRKPQQGARVKKLSTLRKLQQDPRVKEAALWSACHLLSARGPELGLVVRVLMDLLPLLHSQDAAVKEEATATLCSVMQVSAAAIAQRSGLVVEVVEGLLPLQQGSTGALEMLLAHGCARAALGQQQQLLVVVVVEQLCGLLCSQSPPMSASWALALLFLESSTAAAIGDQGQLDMVQRLWQLLLKGNRTAGEAAALALGPLLLIPSARVQLPERDAMLQSVVMRILPPLKGKHQQQQQPKPKQQLLVAIVQGLIPIVLRSEAAAQALCTLLREEEFVGAIAQVKPQLLRQVVEQIVLPLLDADGTSPYAREVLRPLLRNKSFRIVLMRQDEALTHKLLRLFPQVLDAFSQAWDWASAAHQQQELLQQQIVQQQQQQLVWEEAPDGGEALNSAEEGAAEALRFLTLDRRMRLSLSGCCYWPTNLMQGWGCMCQ
jgi:hypothetical protein